MPASRGWRGGIELGLDGLQQVLIGFAPRLFAQQGIDQAVGWIGIHESGSVKGSVVLRKAEAQGFAGSFEAFAQRGGIQ